MNRKIWMLIRNGYGNFKCAAYIAGVPGEWFVAERGVHQGAPLSMRLYQVFINSLIEQLNNYEYGVKIGNIDITAPASADDIAILSPYKPCMNELLTVVHEYGLKWRFHFNIDKCISLV